MVPLFEEVAGIIVKDYASTAFISISFTKVTPKLIYNYK